MFGSLGAFCGSLALAVVDGGLIPFGISIASGVSVLALGTEYLLGLDEAKSKDVQHPTEITACLNVIYHLLAPDEADKLRVTVHAICEENGERYLKQSVPYVGDHQPKHAGRKFLMNCGVIGEAARTGKAVCAKRDPELSWEDYQEALKQRWSFTEEQIRELSTDRYSFAAVPIFRSPADPADRHVVGVVYADSVAPGFFKPARMKQLTSGAGGLVRYFKSHKWEGL